MNVHTPKRIGMLTGGGIAQGLNSVIGGSSEEILRSGNHPIGIPHGWEGMMTEQELIELRTFSRERLMGLLRKPGTILGSSRRKIDIEERPEEAEKLKEMMANYNLQGLIAIGGDDTLTQASKLYAEGILDINGVPKTIDNDVMGTDKTFGYETAVEVATKQLIDMRTDAKSMRRVAGVEIMGRDAGHITLNAGYAAGADITLIPEVLVELDKISARIGEVMQEQRFAVIAIAEGYMDKMEAAGLWTPQEQTEKVVDGFGHTQKKGAAEALLKELKQRDPSLEKNTQVQVAGYAVRNKRPLAHDAVMAAQMGAVAGHLASHDNYGRLSAMINGKVTHVPLSDVGRGRLVDPADYDREQMRMRALPKEMRPES